LRYRGLSDAELQKLEEFFTEAEGDLNGFTFVDPSANLLACTEELNDERWQAGPLLTVSGGLEDAAGARGAWQITNSAGGPQVLEQTVNAPGDYVYCFSVWAKSAQGTAITLSVGEQRGARAAGTEWTRVAFSAQGVAGTASVTFGIELAAGDTVQLFGPQAEAQPGASGYKRGDSGGVYVGARFQDGGFSYTTVAPSAHDVAVTICYANHL
jgi:hypothetical protein